MTSGAKTILVAGIFGGLVVLAGCGGGEDSAPQPVPQQPQEVVLTQDELISEGDAICAEVNAAVGTIEGSSTATEEIKAAQRADIYGGLADRLDELGTPSDGPAPTEVIAAARDLGDPANADTTTALSTLQSAADDYGFTECSDSPEAPTAIAGGTTGSSTSSAGGSVTPAPAPAPAPAPTPNTGGGAGGGAAPTPSGGSSQSGGIGPG